MLESVWYLRQNPYNITHLTLGMLLHYLGKLKIQIFCRCGWKRKQIEFLIATNFVNHPQILIFSVIKIASLSPYLLQIKFSFQCSFTYKLLQSICGTRNSSQQTPLQFVNNQHGIQRQGQDFDEKFVSEDVQTQQRGWQTNFLRKVGQSVMLVSCWKSCGTQTQLTGGQVTADRALPALKKTMRQVMI